jgi:hypothetical protein
MTATLRTQRARSRQAQSGAKRVEVVLDADELDMIGDLRAIRRRSQSEVIKQCLADVHASIFGKQDEASR